MIILLMYIILLGILFRSDFYEMVPDFFFSLLFSLELLKFMAFHMILYECGNSDVEEASRLLDESC
jgi:hypothetical protein